MPTRPAPSGFANPTARPSPGTTSNFTTRPISIATSNSVVPSLGVPQSPVLRPQSVLSQSSLGPSLVSLNGQRKRAVLTKKPPTSRPAKHAYHSSTTGMPTPHQVRRAVPQPSLPDRFSGRISVTPDTTATHRPPTSTVEPHSRASLWITTPTPTTRATLLLPTFMTTHAAVIQNSVVQPPLLSPPPPTAKPTAPFVTPTVLTILKARRPPNIHHTLELATTMEQAGSLVTCMETLEPTILDINL